MDIRKHIIKNFKDASLDEIKSSINSAVSDKDEITLPGMGVFFELLWENSSEEIKEYILKTLQNALK